MRTIMRAVKCIFVYFLSCGLRRYNRLKPVKFAPNGGDGASHVTSIAVELIATAVKFSGRFVGTK